MEKKIKTLMAISGELEKLLRFLGEAEKYGLEVEYGLPAIGETFDLAVAVNQRPEKAKTKEAD